jgi:exosortase K
MSSRPINQRFTWNWSAQLFVVLLVSLALKAYYSTASPEQLRWILAPTTSLVELLSGLRFQFESHSGYLSGDRTFLIAASCAGVNFLITSFLMLSLGKLWRDRPQNPTANRAENKSSGISWGFVPAAAVLAYLATLLANTARIVVALWMHATPVVISGFSRNQLHRFEGIFVYFGFLLLLFMVSEKWNRRNSSERMTTPGSLGTSSLLRQYFFPLMIYYAITLGIPLANIAFHRRMSAGDFWEHSLFVLLIPLPVIFLVVSFSFYKARITGTAGVPPAKSAQREGFNRTLALAHHRDRGRPPPQERAARRL